MLFSSIHLPVPTGPRYEPKKIRANDIYLYYRISSYRNNKGELKHNRKIIGKILHDDNVGMDYFVPNPTYYELHELPLPQVRIPNLIQLFSTKTAFHYLNFKLHSSI